MKFEDRLAFSATVHALGGYLFYQYDALDGTPDCAIKYHIVHRTDVRKLIESGELLRAACGRPVEGTHDHECTEEFPQGAELCPWCCSKLIGKSDESSQ